MLSSANAVCVLPTERHHWTGTGVCGECNERRRACVIARYGESARPSTDEPSIPFLTANFSNTVPVRIDWPATTWSHATGLPLASTATRTRCTYAGRYQPPRMSSSRVHTTLTGTPAFLATTTASTTKSDWGFARRPNPPPRRSEEHTSELQSRLHLVCRLLLEKKKKKPTLP